MIRGLAGKLKAEVHLASALVGGLLSRKDIIPPGFSPAVLFFDTNTDQIKSYILPPGIDSYTLPIRGEGYPINFLILLRAIFVTFTRGLPLQLTYLEALIRHISPKAVITFTDNLPMFFRIASRLPGIRFISIQNGGRISNERIASMPPARPLVNHTYYVWGDFTLDNYIPVWRERTTFKSVGSARLSWYYEALKQDPAIEYDICFASSFRGYYFMQTYLVSSGRYIDAATVRAYCESIASRESDPSILLYNGETDMGLRAEFIVSHTILLLSLLRSYCDRRGAKLAISLAAPTGTEYAEVEEKFFRDLFGDGVCLVKRACDLTTYETIRRSKASLSQFSSISFEFSGTGRPVMICPFPKFIHRYLPECEMFLTSPDQAEFDRRLDKMLSGQCLDTGSLPPDYICANPRNVLAHREIRGEITRAVAALRQ